MQDQTIIAIVNEKGGTGKTTTAVSLSAALGEQGQQVLLVDLDGQAASSRWLGVEEDSRLADALVAGGGLEPIRDVLPGVSLAPASGKLDSVSHELRPTQGGRLRKVLAEQSGFDFILIDCPPSLGNRLIGNALLAATHAIVPVETSILALDGLKILLTTINDIRDGFDHEIILAGVLACRYDARTRLSRLVLAELRRALPGKVFRTVIRENVRIRECPASGQSIMMFANDSHAAEDYRALATEMLTCPDEWRKPVAESCGGPDGEEEGASLVGLRDRAAAMVRQAVRKPGGKASQQAEAPMDETPAAAPPPDQDEQDDPTEYEFPFQADAPDSTPQASHEVIQLAEPAGMFERPAETTGQPTTHEGLQAWATRLGQAKQRLEALEQDMEAQGEQVAPQDDVPQSEEPDDEQAEAHEQDDQPQDAFPALRATLLEMADRQGPDRQTVKAGQ